MFVRSDGSEVTEYMVDLLENYPIGWCGCQDYQYRRQCDQNGDHQSRRCKHIKTARAALGEKFVNEDLKQTKAKNLKTKADQQKARRAAEALPQGTTQVP
jgi:hypothetical protein